MEPVHHVVRDRFAAAARAREEAEARAARALAEEEEARRPRRFLGIPRGGRKKEPPPAGADASGRQRGPHGLRREAEREAPLPVLLADEVKQRRGGRRHLQRWVCVCGRPSMLFGATSYGSPR